MSFLRLLVPSEFVLIRKPQVVLEQAPPMWVMRILSLYNHYNHVPRVIEQDMCLAIILIKSNINGHAGLLAVKILTALCRNGAARPNAHANVTHYLIGYPYKLSLIYNKESIAKLGKLVSPAKAWARSI